MKLKQFIFALVAMLLCFTSPIFAQTEGATDDVEAAALFGDDEYFVNCDYNSSTSGWGKTKFSTYDGAFAKAKSETLAKYRSATIIIEKTNTLSGNCLADEHDGYTKLAVIVKDGATIGVAISKWDMTYPVTVEPGGAIVSARGKSSGYINSHIKNTLTIGSKNSDKKAVLDFHGGSYQSGSVSIMYNGKIVAENATIEVGDFGFSGTGTFNNCDITVAGVLATGKNNNYKQTMTNTTVTVGGVNYQNENTYYSTEGTLLHNLTLDNSTIAVGEGDGVVVKTVTLKNGSSWTVAEGANVNTTNAKVTVYGSVEVPEELANNSTANELVSNTAVSGYTPELPTGVTNLTVELTKVEATSEETTKVTFNVEPKNASGNKVSETSEITFRLPVPAAWAGKKVVVYHDGTALPGTYSVQSGNYVEVKSTQFSEFAVELFSPVAQIGEQKYATLAEAITAAQNGDEIVLTADIELAETTEFPAGKDITLNLNNKKVSAADKNVVKNSGAALTIKNGTIERTGTVAGYAVNVVSGTLEVENVTIVGGLYTSGTSLVATNTKISQASASRHAIYAYNCAVTINSGTYHNYNAGNATVFAYGSSVVTIKDGTFSIDNGKQTSGWTSCLLDANAGGEYVINGGEFKGHFRVQANSAMEINGGTFENTHGEAYNIVGTAVVKGGTFTDNAAKNFAKNNIADDYKLGEDGKVVYAPVVAKIGETKYETLEEAFAAAAEGQTIAMLADATPALTSQRAITKAAVIDLGGKTLTLKEDDLYFGTTTFKNGTIIVDPSVKPSTAVFWMFANQTLTFDNVKIVATGVTGTYLIGLDGNNSDLNLLNGSEIFVNNTSALDLDIICVNASTGNDIKVENSKVNVTNLDGRVFFRGNYTVKDSEVNLAGITKAGFRIEAGQTLSIEGTSEVNITGEPRDGGIHLTDLSATYTKAESATVNATVNEPKVAKVGDNTYRTLAAAVAAVEDGGIITLIANETFTKNNRYNNGGWWDGLGYSGDKSFTIDLGGFTVSQDGALNDYLIWIKNDGAKANTITLKNGTLDAGTSAYCALATASSNVQKITINLENIKLINNNSNGATLKIRGGAELNANAGTIITGKNSYVGIEAVGSKTVVNINEGAEIYQNGKSSNWGCLAGASGNSTINVYGGKGTSAKGGFIAMTSGGTINVEGGEWTANTNGTIANDNNGVLIAQSDKQYNAGAGNSVVNVTGGTFKGGYNCYGNKVGDAQINIKGGNFNAEPTSYVAEDYVAVKNNDVWNVVKAAAKIGKQGYATLQDAFKVAKAGDTVTVFEGTYAMPSMKAGITIVGEGEVVFEGTLTGSLENLTMKNIHIKGANAQRWAYAKGNLVFENVIFEATSVYALHFDGITEGTNLTYKNCTIIGWAALGGSPASCTFEGCTIKDNGTYGVIRTYFDTTIKDCTFDVANANTTDNYEDGIHAVEGANVVVDNCTNAHGEMKDLVNVEGTSIVVLGGVEIKNAAQAGGKDYATFAEALAAVKAGETLTLLADLTMSEILVINKAITLDGNGKKLTSTAARAINVSGANGVTIKNLTINASGERAINVIQNATNVTIDNVTATAANYTVNVASSAPNAVVAINNSTLNGLCTVNVAAAGAKVTVDESTVNCNDNNTTAGEAYAALSLNKDAVGGSIVATNSTINVTAGSDSMKGRNGAENGTVTIDGSTDDVAVMVAAIEYAGTDNYHAFATIDAAVEFAKEGNEVVIFRAGTYSIAGITGKNLTITGAVAGVEFANIGAHNMGGASMTFNNVTFTYANNSTYNGLQHSGNLVYNNCTFNGQVFLYGESETFNNCTFNTTDSNNYNVWTYGAKNVAFNECTFNSAGKSVLIYSESASVNNNVAVTKSKFNASQAVEGKAAIEMDSSLSGAINLTIDSETTATGFAAGNVSGNTLWNNKKGNNDVANNDITVKVGDTVVLAPVYEAQIGEKSYRKLQDAINAVQNGKTITLTDNIAENVTLTEKTGLYYTIDGNGKQFNGSISVNSLSDTEDNRRITIKNINFVDTADANVDFISSVNTNHYPRLTIEGCTFTGSGNDGDVAVRLKSSHSVVIKGCTGTGLHSFIQNTSGWNLTIENVKVTDSKSGFALGTVQGVTVKGVNVDVDGYGIRLDAQYNNNAVLENNTVKAFIPVVVRKASVESSLTFNGENTMTATNTDGIWCAAGTSEYEENGKMPTDATGKVKVTLNDTGLSAAGVYGDYVPVAKIGDVEYTSLEAAFKAATSGCTIEILSDVTVDSKWDCRFNGAKFTVPVTINGNNKTITFTGNVNDNNWNTIFRFEENATVNNLTVDITNATGAQRVISAKKSLNVDGLNIVGAARYGVIYGEGASAADLAATEIVVKNSTLGGTRRALSDNEGGKDVKSVEITGNTFKANVYVSASESIAFNNNTVAGETDLRSYAADNVLNVQAQGNTLAADKKNYIYAKTIVAQEGFETKNPPLKVTTKAELNAALAAAKEGDIIVMDADIDYGTDQLAIAKAITLDLGGKTLTTGNAYGGMSIKNNPTVKNGTIVHASNTAAIKVWNATAFEDLVIDVQGKGDANKTIGGIVLQSGSTTKVGSIKNVTIKGAALTNGIETYNCGDATENVIGAMENVTIDAQGTGLLISAPCGTATNCNIYGGVTGIELWIKGNYSATLALVDSDVKGGEKPVYVHDEFSSNPNIQNNGTLKLAADEATTFTSESGALAAVNIARAENADRTVVDKLIENAIVCVGDVYFDDFAKAFAAATEGQTITILAGTHSEGTVKLPATLKNVTIKGAASVARSTEETILKDMTISAADGNSYSYIGLTFDGITFDNSRILLTGWRNGEETIENLTVTNCTFKNLNDNTNNAPIHINKDASEAVKNFTFTNNVIDGATGGSKSGIYAQVTGNVVVENNVINNVSFRPYVIQVTTDDGIADNFTVKGNTFSGSAVGRAQGLGNNAEGTDNVNLVVSNNIFKGITDSQQICYWNFNAATTTADLSKNYYDIDILANPGKIYYNSAAVSAVDLVAKKVFPIYTELNEDGTINLASEYSLNGSTWGGIDWTLTNDGVLTIAPTKGTPVADKNAASRTYEVGAWREAVRYDRNGEGVAIEGWPYERSKVKTLIIEEGVISIGSFTAQGFTNLTGEVVIPSTVKYIGQEAFQKSTMTKLTFAAGGTEELCIAQGAFKNLIIEEVSLPADRPVHLHAWVFNNCLNLKTAHIPASVVSVHGTNHIDYFKDFNAHSNPTWTKSSEIFAYNKNMETVTFGSEEVRDMFYSYDNNTSDKDYIVATVGLTSYCKIADAIAAVNENGGTIKLHGNAELADTWTIPAGKTVTLDLNGKTISQTKECTASYEMINNKGNLTITGNGKLSFTDTSAGDPTFGWGSYTVRNEGNLVVENGTIEHKGAQAFGTHCIMALYQYSGSTTINGGTISTPNYRSARLWKGDMTINGGTFDGQVWVQAVDSTAKLTVNGGTFTPNGNDASAVFVTNNQYDVQFAVTNGTFNGKVGCSDANKLVGAINGGKFTETAKNGTNAALLATGLAFGEADANGYYAIVDDPATHYIATLDELKAFRDDVNSGRNVYAGVNVYLTADIDLNNEEWEPIGTFDYSFDGNFDGKGHVIKNLKITDNTAANGEAYLAFFGVTANNTIKNFVIENVTIESAGQIVAAAIAYPYYTTVSDITVCGDIAIEGGNYTAGVLAYTRLCQNASKLTVAGKDGSYITGAVTVGGVIADIQTNKGLVVNYSDFNVSGVTISGAKSVGAISGIIGGQALDGVTVKNVTLNSQDGFAGIVAGRLGLASTISNVVIENVTGATAVVGATYGDAKPVQAQVGDTYYAALAEAIEAAEAGATVELLADATLAGGYEDATEGLRIEKEITLNGNGHTIDCGTFQKGIRVYNPTKESDFNVNFNNVTVVNNVTNGRCIDTRSGNINLKVNSSTLIATNGNSQPLTIGGNDPVHRVTLNGTTIDAGNSGYAVISFVSTNVDINGANNSTISGYAAFYLKGDAKTTNLNLGQGVYTGTNNHAVESGLFGTIVLEGDNNVVNLMGTNATVKAVANNTAPQAAFLVRGANNIIKVTKESAKIITEGNAYEAMVNADNAATTQFVDMGVERKLVAENGGYQFYSFEDAVRFAGNEGTIKIVNDFELADTWTIPADKKYTLDLNDKTVTYTSAVAGEDMITNRGNLTITDSSDAKNGKITYNNTDTTASNVTVSTISTEAGSTLVVDGGTIENKTVKADGSSIYSYAIDILTNGNLGDVNVTINGGTVYSDYMAIRQFNNGTACKNSLTINGGYIYGAKRAVQVHMDNNAAVTAISGGKIEAGEGGYALCNFAKTGNFSVIGGEFIGTVYSARENFISGGIYDAEVYAGYCAEGYMPNKNVDGTYGVVLVADVYASIDGVTYGSLKAAIDAAQDGETVKLLVDVELSESLNNTKEITLDLNGKTVTGVDTTTKNFGLINNNGTLTIVGDGIIKLTATVNSGWNRYSAVISNNPGATLTINSGTIEHLGGTDMAYGIDNLTNGNIGDVNCTINGGTIKSTYRAIRQFLNSDSKENNLTINGGYIYGDNKSIFFHDPSTKANNGTLTVAETAEIYSDVYLFVTEGSTEWPVNVSIADYALAEGVNVVSKNVPANYEVVLYNDVHSVEKTYLDELTIVDGELTEFVNKNNKTIGKLTYKRNFGTAKNQAFYVPFEVPMSEISDDFNVYYISNMHAYDNNEDAVADSLVLEAFKVPANAVLKANYPYIIRAKEAGTLMNIELEGATLYSLEEKSVECSSVFMKFEIQGIYSRRVGPEYEGTYLLSGGTWKQMGPETFLDPFRLGMTITESSDSPYTIPADALRSIGIRIAGEQLEDGTTVIYHVEAENNSEDVIFDLSGRRVLKAEKGGIYIINGKKVLVK